MKETERDENGESTWVIGLGHDDGENQLDGRIGVGASIDSVTVSGPLLRPNQCRPAIARTRTSA